MSFEPGTALEFFAGIGLARAGLERAGWRVVFANDIDQKKKQMHEGHWGPDPAYVLKDVFELATSEVPSAELAWASFPCIDLSLAGNRAGLRGGSSSAYWGFFKHLQDKGAGLRPPLVVIENVVGMLTSRDGQDLETIVSGLNELGYVVDILTIDAARFVPQSRPRLFVVGSRNEDALIRGLPSPSATHSAAVLTFMKKRPHLAWGHVPTAELPGRAASFGDVAEAFPDDADIWWPQAAVRKLVSQMSPKHFRAVQMLSQRPTTTFLTVYKRVRATGCMAEVRFDGVAGCLRTPRGGSSRQFVLQLGQEQIRARHMTAVEYGRLQGAGEFQIRVPELQALFGFGDAVCVPAVEWLAVNVLGPMRPAQDPAGV
jgi:DNA (cytosine-5)-methyltransferase 1